MNEIELSCKNFQIFKDLNIKFREGLNIIQGSSMSGKTAILRMIQTLALNPAGNNEDINHEADTMEIQLKFSKILVSNLNNTPVQASVTQNKNNLNPEIINSFKNKQELEFATEVKKYLYQRNIDSGVTYKINNQEYNKIGFKNIYNIDNNFPLVLDEKNDLLNIQDEWSIMFPFDRKDTGLFKLFEDIFAIIDSNSIIKEFNNQYNNLNKEAKEKQEQIQKNENKIKLLQDFFSNTNKNYLEILQEKNNKILLINNLNTKINNATLNNFLNIKVIKYNFLNKIKELELINKLNLNTSKNKTIQIKNYNVTLKEKLYQYNNINQIINKGNKLNSISLKEIKYLNILDKLKTLNTINICLEKNYKIINLLNKNTNNRDTFKLKVEQFSKYIQVIKLISNHFLATRKIKTLHSELKLIPINNCPLCNSKL